MSNFFDFIRNRTANLLRRSPARFSKLPTSANNSDGLDNFVDMAIRYERFVSKETLDGTVRGLLTIGNKDEATQVKRAHETLLKVAAGGSSLTRDDLNNFLLKGDFWALKKNVKLAAGLNKSFAITFQKLSYTDIDELKIKFSQRAFKDSIREELDNPTVINAKDIDFSEEKTFSVIPTATKFLLPVPQFEGGGQPLVYPETNSNAGDPILDYDKKEIGKTGVVFQNRKESVAAAPGDGSAAMIINDITLNQAEKLEAKIAELTSDPEKLTLDQFISVLCYARDELGLTDIYNTTREFIDKNMSPVGQSKGKAFGPHKRDSRDVVQAVYVVGDVEFHGNAQAADGVQKLRQGALIIKDSKGEVRAISREAAKKTYMLPDGRSLDKVVDVADLEVAAAQHPAFFGLYPGQIPVPEKDGEISGRDISSHVIWPLQTSEKPFRQGTYLLPAQRLKIHNP